MSNANQLTERQQQILNRAAKVGHPVGVYQKDCEILCDLGLLEMRVTGLGGHMLRYFLKK